MARKLNVAQVVCTDAFAGVERYVTTLSSGLAASGCTVLVIGGQADRMTAALAPSGVEWESGGTVPRALRRLLRRRHVDIVHAHMTAAELTAVLASPFTRAPIVATRHFAQPRGSSLPARLVGRLVTPRLAAQLAISHYVAGLTEGGSVVVAPGTPARPVGPPSSTREQVVLVAQRLEPEKRTDLALEVWQRSGLAEQGWLLEVAGDGQEREDLERLAARLGVTDSCRFLGAIPDLDPLYRRASVLLAPRPDEPFGLSVIEAMATGLPVVAAAGGGHLETVGVTPGAALYPPDDAVAAGQLLAELASDATRRDSYGKALRMVQQAEFSADRQVAATLDVYRGLRR
jgi:glycosyltransferase involved in cell wall biosynthesis